MNIFCRWMNMPLPTAETTFHHINSCVHNAYVKTSHESMKVSNDNNQTSSSDIANTTVSGDGEWQKRGYSSLNGVVTLIANGKHIDNKSCSKSANSETFGRIRKVLRNILTGDLNIAVNQP